MTTKVLVMVWGILCSLACSSGEDASVRAARASVDECPSPAAEVHGTTHGIEWAELVAVSAEELNAQCLSLCEWTSQCADLDLLACQESCGVVLDQAREQHCEQTLLDAMACMQRNVCDWGLPDVSAMVDLPYHPCALPAHAVQCLLLKPGTLPTVFDRFVGGNNRGIGSIASRGAANGEGFCSRHYMVDGWHELEVSCSSSGQNWCCTCSADKRPVRALSSTAEVCLLQEDLENHVAEACGWRW